MDNFFDVDPRLLLNRFLRSISNLVWHSDTTYPIRSLTQHWPSWLVAASVGVSAILFYDLFVLFGRKVTTPRTAGSPVPHLDLALVLAVYCALVAPTLLLESTTAIFRNRQCLNASSRQGLKRFCPHWGNRRFFVKMKGIQFGVWVSGCAWSMPSFFAQTAYNSNAVWLDPVYEGEPKHSKPVTFDSDQQGMYSPESGNGLPCPE
jgi:hypothetical protein